MKCPSELFVNMRAVIRRTGTGGKRIRTFTHAEYRGPPARDIESPDGALARDRRSPTGIARKRETRADDVPPCGRRCCTLAQLGVAGPRRTKPDPHYPQEVSPYRRIWVPV